MNRELFEELLFSTMCVSKVKEDLFRQIEILFNWYYLLSPDKYKVRNEIYGVSKKVSELELGYWREEEVFKKFRVFIEDSIELKESVVDSAYLHNVLNDTRYMTVAYCLKTKDKLSYKELKKYYLHLNTNSFSVYFQNYFTGKIDFNGNKVSSIYVNNPEIIFNSLIQQSHLKIRQSPVESYYFLNKHFG